LSLAGGSAAEYRIAVIPGDYIGPEVVGAGLAVLRRIEALGLGRFRLETFPYEAAMPTAVVTRRGAERVIRFALELARRRGRRRHVQCVTKSNALAHLLLLWDEVFAEVAADYPDIATGKCHVDAMSMYVITRPASFDVVVTTNLKGDILSDEAAAVTGSIGLAAGANVNPARTAPSLFEPIHGSAPDIAGRGLANPLAAIGAAALTLDWLGQAEAARRVEAAIAAVLAAGSPRTPDLGGDDRTDDVTNAVLTHLG